MARHSKANKSNDTIFYIVLIVFGSLSLGTALHDPVLHGLAALINGWQVGEYETLLMTGSTNAIASADSITPWKMWFFFMFPSLFIIIGTFLINFYVPNRLIRTIGIITIFLNLASLNPQIIGSDSQKAADFLANNGWAELSAYGLQYGILIGVIVIMALYIYIVIENSDKDAISRAKNIIK